MPRIDPFAPGKSPAHPRNARRARDGEVTAEAVDPVDELRAMLTQAEREDQVAPLPGTHVLSQRRDLVVNHLIALDDDEDADPPMITDTTGTTHVLEISDGGGVGQWVPVANNDYESLVKADLVELLKERNLAVSGNRPTLIRRLVEDDKAKADQ